MTLRTFLVGSLSGAIVGWIVWALIVTWLDPTQAGFIGFALFFLSLMLAVSSTMAIVGYGVRRVLAAGQLPAYSVRPALRQGILLGIFLDLLLFLQLFRISRWWVSVIVIVFFVFLELFFLSYDRNARQHRATKEHSQTRA